MGKATPKAAQYLLKEAHAFSQLYSDVSFAIVEENDERAELVFTEGCLGGWGTDQWAVAKNVGLTRYEVCCASPSPFWSGGLHYSSVAAMTTDRTGGSGSI